MNEHSPIRGDQVCVCGHVRDTHEHFRAGGDCGECGASACGSYRPVGSSGSTTFVQRLLRTIGIRGRA